MASVLAIVSRAVFEKMAKGVAPGDVVATDRYASTPAAFEQLTPQDAIFLATVRPPNEALWLVAILEHPAKQGAAWVGAPNTTPVRDITSLAKQLVFTTGKGITARPGALAMSLQTPRLLTAEDVALLRGGPSAAAATYREQAAETPAGKKADADAKAVAAAGEPRLELRNHRAPFEMLAQLPRPQYRQLAQLTTQNDAGKPEQCVDDDGWVGTQLADVVERATGKVTHQLYVMPYGNGQLFENDSLKVAATIIQHDFAMDPDEDDLELRKALAAAYASAQPPLGETIDFRLDWVPPKRSTSEKEERAQQEAAMEDLETALGLSKERYRLFEALTPAQQDTLRTEIPRMSRYEYFRNVERLGIPPYPALARWAGLAPPTVLEQRVPESPWPVWKWLKATQTGETSDAACVTHLTQQLRAATIAELAWYLAATDVPHESSYVLWQRELDSDRAMNDASAHMIRLLAALLDASGDDAAVAFAERAVKHLAEEAEFNLAAVASFALAARARRRREPFPSNFFALAWKADFLGNGTHLRGAWRDIVDTIAPADREAFVVEHAYGFGTSRDEEIRNGRRREVPVLLGTWYVADLVPTEKIAKDMIESVATWDHEPKPVEDALAMIEKVGAICLPHIERVLPTVTGKHKRVLERARKMFAGSRAKPRSS